ncbi:MAG TPA: hypothetical protein VK152_09525 [Paludibacter sp.]|nr:hypothetical protein [Paludibacter sp.]
MGTTNKLIPILLVFVLFTACNKSRFEINTSENRVEVKIQRFDKDLMALDTTNLHAGIQKLYAGYKEFLPAFSSNILVVPATDTAEVARLIGNFLKDTTFSKVNRKTIETFNNVSDIEKKVSDAFTYIHHYFPGIKLPEIYFYVSGFNRPVMLGENFVALGTDMYLGADYPAYQSTTYHYLLYNMRRELVPVDLVSATLFRMFKNNLGDERLVDNMIYRGRVMYLLSVFMPDEKIENLMGYSPEQMKWCGKFEKQIWTAIIDQKDLFSSDQQLIRKYLNEAPFTAPISQESPGRLGTWIGYRIVKSYMDNNDISITGLMDKTNSQEILENSMYRP